MTDTDFDQTSVGKSRRKLMIYGALAVAGAAYVLYERNWSGWWLEQVALSNGTRITIKRRHSYQRSGFLQYNVLNKKDFDEIEFIDASERVARFRELGFRALLLDQDMQTREWYIVGTFSNPFAWSHAFRPKGRYLELRLRNGEWVPQEVSAQNWWRWTNLLIAPPAKTNGNGVVYASEKMKLNHTGARQL